MKKINPLLVIIILLMMIVPAEAERAKEITSPDGYINTPKISLAALRMKKVVLLDFWTYSCINCQRTIPYLNAWYKKYKNYGLEIIGIHTPEFNFEKKYENVMTAVKKFNIQYPVVLNNNHSTWNDYGDLYWPRKALINISGELVYRHTGEGRYEETEQKIQAELQERAKKLGLKLAIPGGTVNPKLTDTVDFEKMQSPETYFGSARNSNFANGIQGLSGVQNIKEAKGIDRNQLYLIGKWNISSEYAESLKPNNRVIYKYNSKYVYLVASAPEGIKIKVLKDGKTLGADAGSDVDKESKTLVKDERLYKLIDDPKGYSEHTLELIIEKPGFKAFTFTFG
jgi:thiol-disulfide isomerase/thioredoxin